jgi:hypothetical protein
VSTVNIINKVSQKPNNIKRSSWPFEKQDFPDRKNQYHVPDNSRPPMKKILEASLIEKCSMYLQVFGNNLEFLEVPECSFAGLIIYKLIRKHLKFCKISKG